MVISDDSFDPDEYAEDTANSVILWYAFRKIMSLLSGIAGTVGYLACDLLFGALAFWYVPGWMAGFLGGFIAWDIAMMVMKGARNRGKKAPLTTRVAWREGPRNPRFWVWVAFRAGYSACFFVVVTAWSSPLVGAVVTAAYTGGAIYIGDALRRSIKESVAAAAFLKDQSPRDTPEI